MNVRTIKNHDDYATAMARLSELMSKSPKPGTEEEGELELLALVVEDFERKIVPPVSPDPIEAILFRMDQMQLTRRDMTQYIGSPSKVSEVLTHKRPLSISMVRRLHEGLGIKAEVLITLPDCRRKPRASNTRKSRPRVVSTHTGR
jgi:HTH-type transcriptional regulator/antitoxin HigA